MGLKKGPESPALIRHIIASRYGHVFPGFPGVSTKAMDKDDAAVN